MTAAADQYIESFNIEIGSELMLKLKDVTLDFTNRTILIPSEAPQKTDIASNFCFSSGMNLITRGEILGKPIMMCIDSGDASFGTLGVNFFEEKKYVEENGQLETLRGAGLGGVSIMPAYRLPDVTVTIGGTTVTPSGLMVKTQGDHLKVANIGLRTLMLYRKVRFNMVDFVITTE